MRKLITFSLLMILILNHHSPALASRVSSRFGWRVHPILHNQRFHRGVDIAAKYGTPIHAVYSGVVIWANRHGGYGNTVLLWHGGQTYTLYGHCSKICVVPRQKVTAGQTIARVGSTGLATGPHLHLEYWRDHQYLDPLSIWQKK